jgi:hypothetical protein
MAARQPERRRTQQQLARRLQLEAGGADAWSNSKIETNECRNQLRLTPPRRQCLAPVAEWPSALLEGERERPRAAQRRGSARDVINPDDAPQATTGRSRSARIDEGRSVTSRKAPQGLHSDRGA